MQETYHDQGAESPVNIAAYYRKIADAKSLEAPVLAAIPHPGGEESPIQ
jgi:hypothetical protein